MIETRRRLPFKNFIEVARIFAAVDNCNEIRKKKNFTFLSATRVGAAACFDLRAAECLHRESLALASHLQSQFN